MKNYLIAILVMLITEMTVAQPNQSRQLKPNWYNLDLEADSVFGISIEKAYGQLLSIKKATPVVVAVIDGGLDINHEDLKNVIWTNVKEIPGNHKDDDSNGYADDVHGWNFLGSGKEDFEYDNDLIVVQLRKYNRMFGDMDSTLIAKKDLPEYRIYIAKREELKSKLDKANQNIASLKQFLEDVNAILKKINKDKPDIEDFKNFVPTNDAERKAQYFMVGVLKKNPDLEGYMDRVKTQLKDNEIDVQYHLNFDYEPRAKYAGEFAESSGKSYGNPNVSGNVPPSHGTHVAGIIAGQRNNNIGIDGVADKVQIMAIRAIPDGYGLDRDQANAIRYAADNGAKVINMSFGLSVALDRQLVKDAVNYALSKDILFIQAAGNGHDNLDLSTSYPNRQTTEDQNFVNSFIKVGASAYSDDDKLAVSFSNYGKQSVDVFAPGLGINSTIPGNKYEAHSGTSMAGPVVTGLAAVIREYYPKLSAPQVKEIIMKSVIKRNALKDLSVSGGVVNAYDALKLASTY
ncbi:MAG: S8 family serine peptidase [Pedobacter sp.]|uniref:S8 family serine peptidase n=1 Tax=Pedobacter sp. TaxID=1411316 RepID=UPI003394F0F5